MLHISAAGAATDFLGELLHDEITMNNAVNIVSEKTDFIRITIILKELQFKKGSNHKNLQKENPEVLISHQF